MGWGKNSSPIKQNCIAHRYAVRQPFRWMPRGMQKSIRRGCGRPYGAALAGAESVILPKKKKKSSPGGLLHIIL